MIFSNFFFSQKLFLIFPRNVNNNSIELDLIKLFDFCVINCIIECNLTFIYSMIFKQQQNLGRLFELFVRLKLFSVQKCSKRIRNDFQLCEIHNQQMLLLQFEARSNWKSHKNIKKKKKKFFTLKLIRSLYTFLKLFHIKTSTHTFVTFRMAFLTVASLMIIDKTDFHSQLT